MKQELRLVLKTYGADPDLIEGARVRPVVADTREDMRQQVEDMKARLWIEVETGLAACPSKTIYVITCM